MTLKPFIDSLFLGLLKAVLSIIAAHSALKMHS
jgi:hypothetical protein